MATQTRSALTVYISLVLCISVLAQQNVATVTGVGSIHVNGEPLASGTSIITPGSMLTTGKNSGAMLSIPGTPPSTINLGTETSLTYQDKFSELNGGAITVDSRTAAVVHFAGFEIVGEGDSRCRVVAEFPRNISALKGMCKVSKGEESVLLKEGQAMTPSEDLAKTEPAAGNNPVPAAKAGIGGWIIVAAAVVAGGTALGIILTRGGHRRPSPSAP